MTLFPRCFPTFFIPISHDMQKTLRRRVDLPDLTSAGQTVRQEYEINKHAEKITGILFTADRDDLMFHRGKVGVMINGEEVIPDEYHAKLLMSGLGVAPAKRYFPVDLEPGNGIVKINYTDTNNPSTVFAPYRVSFYLQFITDEDQ